MGAFEQLKLKSAESNVATGATDAFSALKSKSSGIVPKEEPKKKGIIESVAGFLAPTVTKTVKKIAGGEGLSARDVIGSALEVGSFLVPVGGIARGVGLAAKGLGLAAKGLGRKALEAGALGAATGGLVEAGRAVGEGAGIGETLKRTLTGAAVGAPFGAALPVVGAGARKIANVIKAPIAERAAIKAEQETLLKAGAPDARIATKTLGEGGEVVTHKTATEAVRQGIPEADVALIRAGSSKDKMKMARMLDIRQNQLTNKRITDRATDVVGDTFVNKIAKPIEKLNKEAGKNLDSVARKLSGKKANPSSAVIDFADGLERAGITVRKNKTLNFRGSDFENIAGAQKLIKNVWHRVLRVSRTGDALQLHKTKSYIDEIVNYGKKAEGLSGKAQMLLKNLRHNIDVILDDKFPEYNRVNTQFSDTIRQLNNMGAAIGRTFRLGDTFSDARSGLAMRRILSNTAGRSEILKLLEGMQEVGKKYGLKMDEDIITQANFADILEKMLGTEAPTSLLGQTERAVSGIGIAGADIARGTPSGIISGTIKAGKYAIDVTRGVNQRNKIDALRALLRAN